MTHTDTYYLFTQLLLISIYKYLQCDLLTHLRDVINLKGIVWLFRDEASVREKLEQILAYPAEEWKVH